MTPCLRCLLCCLGMALENELHLLKFSWNVVGFSLEEPDLESVNDSFRWFIPGDAFQSSDISEAGVLIVATVVLCDRLKESLYSLLLWELLRKQFKLITQNLLAVKAICCILSDPKLYF